MISHTCSEYANHNNSWIWKLHLMFQTAKVVYGSSPGLGQTKDKIGICFFSAKHAAL